MPSYRRQGHLITGRRPQVLVRITPLLDRFITELALEHGTSRSAIAHQLMRKGAGLNYHILDSSDFPDSDD